MSVDKLIQVGSNTWLDPETFATLDCAEWRDSLSSLAGEWAVCSQDSRQSHIADARTILDAIEAVQ